MDRAKRRIQARDSIPKRRLLGFEGGQLEKGGASPWSLNAVVPNIRAAESIAEELRALDSVERVVTVANYIPVDQDEKLSIIEDVAMFLAAPPSCSSRRSRY